MKTYEIVLQNGKIKIRHLEQPLDMGYPAKMVFIKERKVSSTGVCTNFPVEFNSVEDAEQFILNGNISADAQIKILKTIKV